MTFTDLSHLPRAEHTSPEGLAPDAEPRFVQLLAEAWAATHDEDKPTAMGTSIRHSDAGKCSRLLAYKAAKIAASDPMDLTGVWNVHLGTAIHDEWQRALQAAFPGAQVELKVGWDDLDASGHIDAVIYSDRIVAYELKTIGGYGFKSAIGKARKGSPAEGPKTEHLLQAALNGLAVDADEIVVGYLAKECISVNQAGGMSDVARFAAEWTITREQYEPLAIAEKARMNGILATLDSGDLARRVMPDGMPARAEIVDPLTGRWELWGDDDTLVDTGSVWQCAYCSHRTLCAKTEPGRVSVESIVKIASAA